MSSQWPRSKSCGGHASAEKGSAPAAARHGARRAAGGLPQLGSSQMRPQAHGAAALRREVGGGGGASEMLARPDLLLARTHGGGLFGARGRPPTSGSGRSTSSRVDGLPPSTPAAGARLFATAPAAPRIPASAVEEATGVRLSSEQLSALRSRYQGGLSLTHSGGAAAFGGEPSSSELRHEVFGSIVLRPGQWPKLRPVDNESAAAKKTCGETFRGTQTSLANGYHAGSMQTACANTAQRWPGGVAGDAGASQRSYFGRQKLPTANVSGLPPPSRNAPWAK
eukprot:TRINITY_DN65556_c0_g1_i2.p1 TRINITY_DN65556_c0_g1~~TRINITY_DN65556_c0_g1_i2.p1  ORF type:complete len:281 (-),score=36.51 TRINITY_DN65556_c0_g1_i2:94-936(-)